MTQHSANHRDDPAMGQVEYVVESRHHGELETWLVVRPAEEFMPRCAEAGIALTDGCRVVVEAESHRPVGVLDSLPPEAPAPMGYNPYFDLPAV